MSADPGNGARSGQPPEIPPMHPEPEPERPWPVVPPPPAPPAPAPERPSRELGRDEVGLTLELADRLLARRIVLVSGPLDQAAASRAAAQVMLLDADGDAPIELQLSCPDGDLAAATMLADTLDLTHVPVHAVVLGSLGGPAVAVLAAADRRTAHPHSVFALREPHGSAGGSADELLAAAQQHEQLLRGVRDRIAEASGRGHEEVAADLRAGRVLTAAEALDYGLVDEVLSPPASPARAPRSR